jgi:hypothetical protein
MTQFCGAATALMLAAVFAGACAAPPAPPATTAVPDFNGTWGHATVIGLEQVQPVKRPDGSVCLVGCGPETADAGGGEPPPPDFPKYKPEFQAQVTSLSDQQVTLDTVLRCYPPGVPRIGPPSKIVQTAREVVFLYEDYNGSFYRIIPLDGRPRAADVPRSHLGSASGRFDGQELVVETDHFDDETWLTDNGAFHTKELRVVERLRRDGDTLHYQATAIDPAVLAEPWVLKPRTLTRSLRELEEPPPCIERDIDDIIDLSQHHDNPR